MAWLGTWAKRTKITIDNTNIDSDLTHFSVPIVLGTSVGQSSQDLSRIFDEVGSNGLKIAITKSDGTTQIYGDEELWDSGTEATVIHVAKSDLDILSASVTELYIYYDSAQSDNTTYISMSGGTAAQSVWDSNFKAVYHMAQDPSGGTDCILDSTVNANHGTPSGSMTSADLVDGLIGKALDFDGVNDQIDIPQLLSSPTEISIESILKTKSSGAEYRAVTHNNDDPYVSFRLNQGGSANRLQVNLKHLSGETNLATTAYTLTGYNYITTTAKENDYHKLYVNENHISVDTAIGTFLAALTTNNVLGASRSASSFLFGLIGEIRFSDIVRSAAWIKATHYALTDDLLTYGSEEIAGLKITAEPGSYAITGSDADLISGMNIIEAGSGAYVITGSDADLISPKFIAAGSGAYILTGSDADLINPKFIVASPGAYVLTGSDITFARVDADAGVYTLTGSDVDFKIGLGPTVPGVPVYLFTLTGAPDSTTDIEIPIKSIQARLRSGSPTYLQIVIPGMGYAAQINARPNGVMEIDLAYLISGEYTNRETIIQVNLEDIRIDRGAVNKSISLSGHKQKTFVKKSITLDGATYKNTLSGDIRYRLAEPNVYLNPGDSVTIDTDTFDANVISYFISARRTTMELAES